MRKKWRSIKYISLNKENDQNMWTKIYHDKKRWKLTGKNMNDLNKNITTIWEAFKYCLAILSVKGGWAVLFCSIPSPFWFFFNLIYSNSWLIWAKVLQGQKKQGKSVKSDIKWRIRPIVVRWSNPSSLFCFPHSSYALLWFLLSDGS